MNDEIHKSERDTLCLWQPSGFPHLYYIRLLPKCQIHFDENPELCKAAAISTKASPRSDCVLRDCHVASLLAMTRQGSARCISALLPLNIPYKAVTDRRYTPYFGVCRFHGRLYGAGVRSRARLSPPLQCTAESLVQLSTFHFQFSTSIPLFLYT